MSDRAIDVEIEITPEMIKAGLAAYSRWDSRVEETEGLVIAIFAAMLSVIPPDAMKVVETELAE